jgi:amino acid adenylation domain-containing protein
MTLLAAFQVLLGRLSGQEDFAVGSPIAGRTRQEIEGLIGFFVNNLVLRTDLTGEPSFRELLGRARETTLAAYANQDLPFEKLVEELRPAREIGQTPLFQVVFNLLPGSAGESRGFPDISTEVLDRTDGEGRFDLVLSAVDGERIRLRLACDAEIFDESTVSSYFDALQTLLAAAIETPDAPVSRLSLLDEVQRHAVVVVPNRTEKPYPHDATLASLFDEQVQRTPDAVAVVFEDRSLTYRQLDQYANRFATRLAGLGVGPGTRLALAMNRSERLVVGLLGTIKAGAAWVPIDPGYPEERVAWLLQDSAAPVLLTESTFLTGFDPATMQVVLLDALPEEEDDGLPAESFAARRAQPQDEAYVIYTSGSTGRPKGAINSQRGICNRLRWMREEYAIGCNDVFLHKAPIGFDVAVSELLTPLVSGARLVLARPGGQVDPVYLMEEIERHGVTILSAVPTMLRYLVDLIEPGKGSSLRHVFSGGEALSIELAESFQARLGAQLHNLYGPAEAAIAVAHWRCERNPGLARVPIGRPVANTQLYVLDRYAQPAPVGVPGELYVGGVQVGLGYLGREDLTVEKFLADPFSSEPGARLYRTGDRVRRRSDGTLEFLGRMDEQVQLRGVRVEPGEIEVVLRSVEGVTDAVVVARDAEGNLVREGNAEQLVAFVTAREPVERDALHSALARRLPANMLPASYAVVDRIPLSPNGKVDRRALLESFIESRREAVYMPPAAPLEQLIAGIWQELLRVERIDRHDNFFDLGGHSLLSVRFVAKFQEATGLRINPRELVFQTLAQLAAAHADTITVQLPDEGLGFLARLRRRLQRSVSGESAT